MPRGTGMSVTPRRKRTPMAPTGFGVVDLFKARLVNQEAPPSHAEFLAGMRAKQVAGRLVNPATAVLLDRLERSINTGSLGAADNQENTRGNRYSE